MQPLGFLVEFQYPTVRREAQDHTAGRLHQRAVALLACPQCSLGLLALADVANNRQQVPVCDHFHAHLDRDECSVPTAHAPLEHEGLPAAQFMYEDAAGRRLTLYIRKETGLDNTSFQFAERDGLGSFYWIDRPLAYALAGRLGREELMALANAVYAQLEQR